MRSLLVLISLSCSPLLAVSTYYPQNIVDSIETDSLKNQELKDALYDVLSKSHLSNQNSPDTLGCNTSEANCYKRKSVNYKNARIFLFGKLHLKKDSQGFYIQDVYCQKNYRSNIGPDKIPNSNLINCEHTWPKDNFNKNMSYVAQETDLHHLFPTDSKANSTRSNFDFGQIEDFGEPLPNCAASMRESEEHSRLFRFQPPASHIGNVARAMFYFSVRYKVKIDPAQEAAFREWADSDPVDQEEIDRNKAIYQFQRDRNPFIDFPELYKSISDF